MWNMTNFAELERMEPQWDGKVIIKWGSYPVLWEYSGDVSLLNFGEDVIDLGEMVITLEEA